MFIFITAVVAFAFLDSANSLSCLTCSGAASLADCYKNGAVRYCWKPNQVCRTEIRLERPDTATGIYGYRKIYASCKQKSACKNEMERNLISCRHHNIAKPTRCVTCCEENNCHEQMTKVKCKPEIRELFKRFDDNGDDIVTEEEAIRQARFRDMRSDNYYKQLFDQVTVNFSIKGAKFDEFAAAIWAWHIENFNIFDKSGDGYFTKWEFRTFVQNLFGQHKLVRVTREQADEMFLERAGNRWRIGVCDILFLYSTKISDKITVPRCDYKVILSPQNGSVNCSNENLSGSKCKFECSSGFRLIGETSEMTCLDDGVWEGKVPRCDRVLCEPLKISKPRDTKISCTNKNIALSQCTAICDESQGYKVFGSNSTMCNDIGEWTGPIGCCSKPCPPYAHLDVILVFDSSSSVGSENWVRLMKFATNIMSSFIIGRDDVRVGALRYNKFVDVESEFLLGEIETFDELQKTLANFPYDGSGTMTGNALRHVSEVSIKAPGNRPGVRDVVLVLTDGCSKDNVAQPANEIKATGADVNVIGIKNEGGCMDMEQMQAIASEPTDMHIMIVEDGFAALTDHFINRIGDLVCGDPCQ